jgi:hypothetical protein
LSRQPAAVRFQAEHSNDCWQFDMSPSDLKQIKKPSWVREDGIPPTLMLFSTVDDRSGTAYQKYRCVYGEDAGAALLELIKKRHKPIALFVDEAHDLHGKTLIGLKRLIEVVRSGGGTLSVVLAGHPKLKNDLSRPSMEEIGARATVFPLEPFGPERRKYIQWLIGQAVGPKTKIDALITDEALTLLSDRLTTPLQFEQYLTRDFEEAYKIGQKPVATEIVEGVLVADIDALDARLMRNGYNMKSLCDLLNSKPREINAFIHGQLPPERTQQLSSQLLAVGVPL